MFDEASPRKINLDVTKDGYIRVFGDPGNFEWDVPGWSDACLKLNEPRKDK
jgi:hypothetical protein